MSDNEPSSKNRTRLYVAVAVLIGAIILLVVTEFASIDGDPDTQPADTPQESGALHRVDRPFFVA